MAILNTKQVAEMIGVSPITLRGWRAVGKGPTSFNVGQSVRYRSEDVDAWMNQQYETTKIGGAA